MIFAIEKKAWTSTCSRSRLSKHDRDYRPSIGTHDAGLGAWAVNWIRNSGSPAMPLVQRKGLNLRRFFFIIRIQPLRI